MVIDKQALFKELQKNPDRYWKVSLFKEKGFKRKQCEKCGKFFWTLTEQKICNDASCRTYDFIDNPPTKKKLDYFETWNAIEKFFVKEGHKSLETFPVVCRWFPLYFTIAGIVDFYRLTDGELDFEFPANPCVVNQTCLRYNDIPNVGLNGKSYTCFEMVNQQSLFDGKQGYWKDRCIELDFNLLTKVFGIGPDEITFIEDAWVGPSAFGSSLEFHVRGLELGNAVFTEFVGTPENYKEMKAKVIDMGAGLNRLAWISNGTPTSYDVVFGDVINKLIKESDVDYDKKFFLQYSKFAGNLNIDEIPDLKLARIWVAKQLGVSVGELEEKVAAIEALYAIADHTRNLAFVIADGGIPSNAGGGYNLRVIFRRALSFLDKFKWNFKITDVIDWHIDYLRKFAPKLEKRRDEIHEILGIEEKRYAVSKERTKRIVESILKLNKMPSEDELIKYYDSEGITPEQLVEAGLKIEIPPKFYSRITERHVAGRMEEGRLQLDLKGLPETELLYYKDPLLLEFNAKVLKTFEGNWVALDKTAFYPTGGGQLFDKGTINGVPVVDIQKIHGIVLHKLADKVPEGKTVSCKVDKERRLKIMRHHTATHIVLSSARKVLGWHIWQSGAEKDEDKARIDFTHYEALTDEEIEKIEKAANEIVMKDLPVKIEWMPRLKAEQKYGFGIYQGGVIPQKELRIVSVGNIDNEACGGIHVKSTKEVGFISVLRSKRIQDGIVRLEYVAGDVAVNSLEEKEKILKEVATKLKVKEEEVPKSVEKLFTDWKKKRKEKK